MSSINPNHRVTWHCKDCNCDTFTEYYMVHNEVWKQACPVDQQIKLCIQCLETRLGRQLTPTDFTDCPLNTEDCPWERSPLLQKRLKGL